MSRSGGGASPLCPGRGPLTPVLSPQTWPRGWSCGDAELPGLGRCVLHSHGRPSQGCRVPPWGLGRHLGPCSLQAPNQAARASVTRVPRLCDALFVGKPGRAPGQGSPWAPGPPRPAPGGAATLPRVCACAVSSRPPHLCQRVPKHTWHSEYALRGDTRPTPGQQINSLPLHSPLWSPAPCGDPRGAGLGPDTRPQVGERRRKGPGHPPAPLAPSRDKASVLRPNTGQKVSPEGPEERLK